MRMFYLYLLIWCQAAETMIDQQADLGQNVTLICDLDEKEGYWLIQNYPYSPVLILRYFDHDPYYYNPSFKQKYSVNSKNHLIINNITSDELGVYYCMSAKSNPKFSSSTRLSFVEPTLLNECHNCSVVKYIQQNQASWLTLIIISGVLMTALVSVIIGLLKVYACRNNRSAEHSQQPHDTGLQLTPTTQQQPGLNQLQNPEVDTLMPCPLSSTYVALQLPKLQTG